MERIDPSQNPLTHILRRQFMPVLQMMRQAIVDCPDSVWADEDGNRPIWQQAYHAISGIGFFFRDPAEPPAFPAFHCDDAAMMNAGAKPVMSRQQILDYLEQMQARSERLFEKLTDRTLLDEHEFFGRRFTWADRILSQTRHIQHHVGTICAQLRRKTGTGPQWRGFQEE